MSSIVKTALLTALAVPAGLAQAQAPSATSRVGAEYEITRSYETSGQGSDQSSSSSSGHDSLLEKIVATREGGVELEYDLPRIATSEDRKRNWQFPVRVFRSASGTMQLLNRAELETRIGSWLKAAGWTRDVCGRWIFTWNAFRIECDPQSVIATLRDYDLRSVDLREGALIRDENSRKPETLTRTTRASGAVFEARMQVNPEAVRRARAESDVVVGELSQKPVTLEAALRERAKESVSGTITITFVADAQGNVWRRTRTVKLTTRKPHGVTETSTATQVTARRPAEPTGR